MYSVQSSAQFNRLFGKLLRKHPELGTVPLLLKNVLSSDPYNLTRKYKIKKLVDVTDGYWRISIGVFRVRYDVLGRTVLLKSIRHRRDSYRGKDL
jgi:mRNA-degrading endonuclease RelE of RelBE toxin-antitoxin system